MFVTGSLIHIKLIQNKTMRIVVPLVDSIDNITWLIASYVHQTPQKYLYLVD